MRSTVGITALVAFSAVSAWGSGSWIPWIEASDLRAVLALPALEAAQRAEQAAPSQRSDVTAILVDVVVRTRGGEPVADLRAEDFEVFEDGIRQELGSLTPIFRNPAGRPLGSRTAAASTGTAAPSLGSVPRAVAEAQATPTEVLAIVFDRLSGEARASAYKAAVGYLSSDHPDRIIGVYGLDLSLIPYQPFTRDMARVRQGIDAFAGRATSTFGAGAEQLAAVERSLQADQQTNAVAAGADSTAQGSAAVEQALAEAAQRSLQTFETLERDQRGYSTANGLMAVVSGMRTMPGRKAIVFFSEGLSIPPNVQERFTSVIAAANRANVSIYSIDAAGLRTESTLEQTRTETGLNTRRRLNRDPSRDVTGGPMMAELERNEDSLRYDPHSGLGQLSENTGGLLIANTNDFRPGLARVDSDLRNYYMLSYVPSNDEFDGKYRTIGVRVNRPGVVVQHRKGYLAVRVPPGDPVLTYEAPALAMLEVTPVPNAFPVRAAALRFPEPDRTGLTPVVVEVPTAGITFQPGDDGATYTTDFTVLVRFTDVRGEVVNKASQQYELQGPVGQMEAARENGEIIFYRELELPPGLYTMETVVHDAIAGTASVRFSTVEKPRVTPDQLRMSTIVLVRRSESVPESERIPGSPLYVGDVLLYPRLGTALKHGVDDELPFYFTVYLPQGGGKPRATVELLHNAKAVASVALPLTEPDARRRIKQVSRIPVDSLEPGTYELSVVVRHGNTAIRQTTDFRVVG